MQVFGNVATTPEAVKSKSTGRTFFQFRLAESTRAAQGADSGEPTWYTVRCMRTEDPGLSKGDFVKVTGKLKTDFYLSREGKPTGTLLIIAFEASKIAKPASNAIPGKVEMSASVPATAHAVANVIEWQD